MAGQAMFVIFLFLFQLKDIVSAQDKENLLINVTARVLEDNQESNLQIHFNFSVVGRNNILLNDVPVAYSGVTRVNCQALLLNSTNGSSVFEGGDLVSTVTRVMVTDSRLHDDYEEVVTLYVFSEVIELEGKQVQQPDMSGVKILLIDDFVKQSEYTNIYPMTHSEIVKVSQENNVVFTDPTNYKREQMMLQTTSQYPLKNLETTQEEIAPAGKLPETPLRMDPDLLTDILYKPNAVEAKSQEDMIPIKSTPKEFLSYSAMCRWAEDFRERLRYFFSESIPTFFLIMCVVVVGVVGSGLIVKMLEFVFPFFEHKPVCQLTSVTLLTEDEKHPLVENRELEEEEVMALN
ncbi:glycoprotein integral membrane protein 1 [Corythoichthys intestinalis]|uniref:glycoprotein integral membrane protein 1 n=1 Tax=Corythoichthys intestinalis TaxID=161448 RepID=UPI0025A50950|nr:glycoprotein integral membrane protein 1 [Corythoichthys intestinalis]